MTMLGVNIDHIATIREARKTNEPDPVAAAVIAEFAGAQGSRSICEVTADTFRIVTSNYSVKRLRLVSISDSRNR
jgi:hypothetical protein